MYSEGLIVKPHKWAKEIHAWADGAEIEGRSSKKFEWVDVENPSWDEDYEYRIKPQPKEPQYLNVYGWLETQNIRFDKDFGPYVGKIKLED